MASNPDINAILAALSNAGANPNAGTPAPVSQTPQQPQPPLPAGYPHVVSAATPANPLAGLALPQPSNHGSLDLSSIKPISSGNVSLADAIANAHPPRSGGGGRDDRYALQRRDRSRSPRRDNFDGYNPYRDERRDERRRDSPGRPRIASPPRAYGVGNNYGYGFPPSEMLDDNTEVITVESSAVGLIIGRKGENLQRVEQSTGARVQFMSDEKKPTRKCKVSGTPRQRHDAISDIFKTAAENPKRSNVNSTPVHTDNQPPMREGEQSVQIMVPDKTVGLIIGRRGETIADLQERSGCHVNILGENKSVNGFRPVNLIGTREAAAKARQLIMEVVDSDTRVGDQQSRGGPPAMHTPYGAPPPMAYDPYAPHGGASYGAPPDPNAKITETLMVPSEAVGMIIGKKGETIRDMQDIHKCKINVHQPQGEDIQRPIDLIGPRAAIEGAKSAILEKVQTVREKQGGLRADNMPRNDPYAAQHVAQHAPQPAHAGYGYPAAAAHPAQPAYALPAQQPDPYAMYGGYEAYLELWRRSQAGLPPS